MNVGKNRDDDRFVKDSVIAFTVYCDEYELSIDDGRNLADRIGDEIFYTAEDREWGN